MLTRRQLIASGAGVLVAGSVRSAATQEAAELQINSTRYIATNADTGAIFAQRGARDQVAIASITKVFTAIEALNLAPLDHQITTTSDDMVSADATAMGFGPGETFTLEELIYGMMLPSGNDAAHAIARSLGTREGDTAEEATQRFMDLINHRVQLMGLKDTNLINPDGWGVPDHYSSAADVAAFMAYASQNDFLVNVMGTANYTTSAGYVLQNTNKVLTSSPSVIGGKTGYDWDSGYCLVQIAERNNTRIIAVTLDGVAPNDWYNDNLVLLDYGFEQQKALGNKEFDGESVAWVDPAPILFAETGPAVAAITGQSDSGEQVIATEEVDLPARTTSVTSAATEPDVSFSGQRSNAVLAGVGAAVLAGVAGVGRWLDFGGDTSAETIRPAVSALAGSLKRGLPVIPMPKRNQSKPLSDGEQSDLNAFDDQDAELFFDQPSDETSQSSPQT